MNKVDIRIMAHKSRKKNVDVLLKALNLDKEAVTWDDRKDGGDALYTAKKAWMSPWPTGCTHRAVLADDAKVCKGFKAIVEQLAALHVDDIYTLFHTSPKIDGAPVANVCSKMCFGVGIMIPRGMIRPIFENPTRPEDDMNVTFYALSKRIRVLTPMPSIVQHMPFDSLIGTTGTATSPSFMDDPKQDWTSRDVIDIG